MNRLKPAGTEPNQDFVRAFDNFSTFEQAVAFIETWIKVEKHNPVDFTIDLPAVVERGKAIRRVLLHTGTQRSGSILTQDLTDSEEGYVFNFLIELLDEVCSSELTMFIVRTVWNYLRSQPLKITID